MQQRSSVHHLHNGRSGRIMTAREAVQLIAGGLYGFAQENYCTYGKPSLSSTYTDGPGGTVFSSPNASAYNFLLGIGRRF